MRREFFRRRFLKAMIFGPAIEPAIASLEAQRAYFDNLDGEFNPEQFLRTQARQAGQRFGCEHAVEFRLLLL